MNAYLYTGLFNSPPVNLPPLARFAFSCTGRSCTFDSKNSADDVRITARSWKFGDGKSGTGRAVTHVYPAAGTYTVTLTVRDGGNKTGTIAKTLTIP